MDKEEKKKKTEQKDELMENGRRYPVEQVSNTGEPTKKEVKAAVILVMFFLFGGLSIYITVSSIYNIGKRDGQRLQIEHIRQLPLHGNDTTKSINPLNRPQYGRSTEE